MERLIEKSVTQIKQRIEFWFFKYFNKAKEDFNGSEIFTLFELIDMELQSKLKQQLNLENNEMPVLILKISSSEFIINTTKKFIRLDNNKTEIIDYSDFEWHNGYTSIFVDKEKLISTKNNGHLLEFGLRKRKGEVVYWKIPTGFPGYGFWNVTKKCKLIGRKFKLID